MSDMIKIIIAVLVGWIGASIIILFCEGVLEGVRKQREKDKRSGE